MNPISSFNPSLSSPIVRFGNDTTDSGFEEEKLSRKEKRALKKADKQAEKELNKTPNGYKVAKARKSNWFKGLTGFVALLAGGGSLVQMEGRTDIMDSRSQINDITHIQAQFDDFERRADVIRDNSFLSSNDTGELTKGLRSDFYFAMNSILQTVEDYGNVNVNENDFEEVLNLLDDGAFSEEEIEITNFILKNAIEDGTIGDYKTVFNEWYEDVAENRVTSIRDRANLRREVVRVLDELENRKQLDDTADAVTDVSALMAAMFLTASVLPSKKLKKLEAEQQSK